MLARCPATARSPAAGVSCNMLTRQDKRWAMFFKKKRSRSNPRESALPKMARGRRFSGTRPRRVGECPWEPGRIPGGKIPYDKKPSVVRAKAAAAQSE